MSYLLGFALDLDIVYTQGDVMVLRKLAVLSERFIRLKIEYAVYLDDAHRSRGNDIVFGCGKDGFSAFSEVIQE